jgi:hypothetical protein
MTSEAKLTKLVGFYADPEMQRIIFSRAAETTEGNASAYLRRLAVADITAAQSRPTGVQADILERLASLYRPRIAAQLGALLRASQTDQPALVERLLLELWECLARGSSADHIQILDAKTSPSAPSAQFAADLASTKKRLAIEAANARARRARP